MEEDQSLSFHTKTYAYILWLIFALGVFANCSASGVGVRNGDTPPDRSLSLKNCGWLPVSETYLPDYKGFSNSEIAFDHTGNLWLGFHSKSQNLSRRSDRQAQFSVVSISGRSTTCTYRLQRPSSTSNIDSVLVSNDDNIFVLAGDSLHLVDRNDLSKDIQTLRLSGDQYILLQSSNRKALAKFVRAFGENGEATLTWISPGTLDTPLICHLGSTTAIREASITSELRNVMVSVGKDGFPSILKVDNCGTFQIVAKESETSNDLNIIGNSLISTHLDGLMVTSLIGKLLFEHRFSPLERFEVFTTPQVSEDESRWAVVIDTLQATKPFWDMLDMNAKVVKRRIDIYDTSTWRLIRQIDIPTASRGRLKMAFSPNGKSLAIVIHDTVNIYDDLP
jgi:hypothetical protein